MFLWISIYVELSLIQDEEIEMEDAEDWSIVDIDSSDKKNSLAVVEYIDDIYAYYKKAEVEMLSPLSLLFARVFRLSIICTMLIRIMACCGVVIFFNCLSNSFGYGLISTFMIIKL